MNENVSDINRRSFIAGSVIATGIAATAITGNNLAAKDEKATSKFKMHYGPHPGTFRAHAGNEVIDQIKFAADQGFTAWEHNGLPKESPEMQEKIGKTLADLDMKMGVFVAYANFDEPTFANGTPEQHEEILTSIQSAVEIAKRVGANEFTVVPGSVDQQGNVGEKWNKYGGPRLEMGYQTANVIDLLRKCSEIIEPHDLVMVLEPLNWHANHGGTFLERSDQAFAICRAVDSPSCKILFDIYHQQITEGNLIPNIDKCWSEIAYFQAGDNPGRKEPGSGEINYKNVFQYIHDRSQKENREFVIGMEHGMTGKGKEGELALIEAYRKVDVD